MPALSIIVPVYNKVTRLDACIKSILAQTHNDFELILVNDGSTDGSDKLCENYQTIDDRIIYIYQDNQGVSKARNTGLAAAKGNYIGFIDADDTIQADMFKLLADNIVSYDADISVCDIQIIDPNTNNTLDTEPIKTIVLDKDEAMIKLLDGKLDWSANNKIYKSSLAKSINFAGRMNEDLFYCFNIINRVTGKIVYANAKMYNYIKSENSVSLSRFSAVQMESIKVSRSILNIISNSNNKLLPQAKVFDFIANVSILNLIILAGVNNFKNDYETVVNNLKKYTAFTKPTEGITTKQRLGYRLFNFNKNLYCKLFKLYCRYSSSEAGKKVL